METHDIHSQPLDTLRLLVLEDNPVSRALLQENLRFLGAQVRACSTAGEACALLAADPFDCVLTDVHLPDVAAADLPGRLRPHPDGPPLIALTGVVGQRNRQALVQHGFHVCLAKPVDLQTLVSTILSVCPETRK